MTQGERNVKKLQGVILMLAAVALACAAYLGNQADNLNTKSEVLGIQRDIRIARLNDAPALAALHTERLTLLTGRWFPSQGVIFRLMLSAFLAWIALACLTQPGEAATATELAPSAQKPPPRP